MDYRGLRRLPEVVVAVEIGSPKVDAILKFHFCPGDRSFLLPDVCPISSAGRYESDKNLRLKPEVTHTKRLRRYGITP
jgi:hypothetical protein